MTDKAGNATLLCVPVGMPKLPRCPPKPLDRVSTYVLPPPSGLLSDPLHEVLNQIACSFDEGIADLARVNAVLRERVWETKLLHNVVENQRQMAEVEKFATGSSGCSSVGTQITVLESHQDNEETPADDTKEDATQFYVSEEILFDSANPGKHEISTDAKVELLSMLDDMVKVDSGSGKSLRESFSRGGLRQSFSRQSLCTNRSGKSGASRHSRHSLLNTLNVLGVYPELEAGEPEPEAKSRWQLKEDWTTFLDVEFQGSKRSYSRTGCDFVDLSTEYAFVEEIHGWSKYVIATPGSPYRIAWEICGACLICYDLIVLPLLVFDPPDNVARTVIDKVTLVFWLLNVFASCTMGYVDNGVLVLNPRNILIKYLKSWFIVDALTLPPDWIFEIATWISGGGKSEAGSFTKFLRALRLLRLARLLRLVKLRNAWNQIYDMIDSEKVGILLDVWKMVLMLLVVNHYMACAWYLVGDMQQGLNWLKYHGFTRAEADWGHQYLVAYHWSVTQFTPSSMNVQPHSIGERVFNVAAVVFALVGFSYIVGSITGSLHRLRTMAEEETKNFWVLRRFLRKNGIQRDLGMRIRSYIETRWFQQQSMVNLKSVKFLDLLSEQLTSELLCAMHGRSLCIHPMFTKLKEESFITIQRIAIKGVEQDLFAPGDFVFISGELAVNMSIVTSGKMQYCRSLSETSSRVPLEKEELVEALEDWIAEPVLWVHTWPHLGDLKSLTPTELLLVKPGCFVEVVRRNPMAFDRVSSYAHKYCVWLSEQEDDYLSDISQGEDVGDMLWGFLNEDDKHDGVKRNDGTTVPSWTAAYRKVAKSYMRDNIKVTTGI